VAVTILPANQRVPASRGAKAAPTYILRLRAPPGRDDRDRIRSLRRLLKFALRACGLRAIEVREEPTP
jgi:hypothetical protein